MLKNTCISLIFLFPFLFFFGSTANAYWITAYYANARKKTMPISAIPWHMYTEVNHFAAATGENGTISMLYLTQSDINEFVAAAHAAGKKAIVTIKDGGPGFIDATNADNIDTFVSNIKSFVDNNGYDGVDIDWERDLDSDQYVIQCVKLCSRLREALGYSKLISIASGSPGKMPIVAAKSQEYIDHINAMTYDADWGKSFTWHNAPLFQNDKYWPTTDWEVRYLTDAGVARSKIGIGIPFYGRRWTGATEPLQKSGIKQSGWINYRDLVTDPTRWIDSYKKWDSTYYADYISDTSRNEFTSYNGIRSIQEYVKWMKSQGFGGIFCFVLDYEYLSNQTGDARYPLSTAIWQNVLGGTQPMVGINDLTVVRSSETFVVLQWTPPSNKTVQTYILETNCLNSMIERPLTSEVVTIDPMQLSLTNYTTLMLRGLYPGCKYSFALQYFTKTGEYSALSNHVEVTTFVQFIDDDLDGSDPFITRDADSLFVADNNRNMGFRWSSWKSLGAQNYLINVRISDTNQLLFSRTVQDTVLVFQGEPKTRYVVEVRPQNGASENLGTINSRPIMCIPESLLPPGKPYIPNE